MYSRMDFTPLSSDEKCVMTKLTHSGPPDYIVETTANYLARRGPIKAGRICILDKSKNNEEYNVAYITQDNLDKFVKGKNDAIDVHITPDTTETLLVESIGTIEKKSDGGRRRLRKTKRGRRHRTKRTRSRK